MKPPLFSTLALALAFSAPGILAQSAAPAPVDTFAVRLGPNAPPIAAAPAAVLNGQAVGEQFCNALHCVVLTTALGHVTVLRNLEAQGFITLEPLPDAHRVFFQHATYDSQAGVFDQDFPGRSDLGASSSVGLFVIVFKSYPERSWVDQLEQAGLIALEPAQTMAYYVYGPRATLATAGHRFPFVYSALEVPGGIKRFNIDFSDDGDAPEPTGVATVQTKHALVVNLLRSATGVEPELVYQTGTITAYASPLSRADALSISALPEVLSVTRGGHAGPSDERTNRVIGGTFQTPGSSWPPPSPTPVLPSNTGTPRYWDNYITQFNNLLAGFTGQGFNLSNQTIAFLDTGIDSGLQRGGIAYCPPYLIAPDGTCRLVFTTDVTQDFSLPERRADDHSYHGTLTTSIAAGFAGSQSSGRDIDSPPSVYGGYAFTQGVAQGAKVAMCKFFANVIPPVPACNNLETYRTLNGQQFQNNDTDTPRRLNYALVELGSSVLLPDGVTGPEARLFNHSWNMDTINYEADAVVLDETTRLLSRATFTFDGGQLRTGPSAPALHIVSAGNIGQFYPPPGPPPPPLQSWPNPAQVTAPAVAKNIITVGGTESYNQEAYAPNCGDVNLQYADNPHQIYGNSRTGFPNLRLKPDLVAPATASYGRTSVEASGCPAACNMDLDQTGQYAWSIGTSFAAPAGAGAAAMAAEWLKAWHNPPSPALVKAALIATAQTLTRLPVCGVGCSTCCAYCGEMRPSPDKYQGWGGIALDHLFRDPTNYFFSDQANTLSTNGQIWTQTLTIADRTKDINIALVWTDRASPTTDASLVNLVNDLDLQVSYVYSGITHHDYGNNYYTNIDSCTRDGYSLLDPSPVVYDRKNNVERINIQGNSIPPGVTTITVTVSAFSLTGDGINPGSNSVFQQDFALGVENAHY